MFIIECKIKNRKLHKQSQNLCNIKWDRIKSIKMIQSKSQFMISSAKSYTQQKIQ